MKDRFELAVEAWRTRHKLADDDPLVALVELLGLHLDHRLSADTGRKRECISKWVILIAITVAAAGGFVLGRWGYGH